MIKRFYILFLVLISFSIFAMPYGVEAIPAPEILIYPKTYIAGQEVFYLEGKALPNSQITIFFKKSNLPESSVKNWEVSSDKEGNFLFFTEELFKPGDYLLSAKTKDFSGTVSQPTPEYAVKVIIAGLSLGPWIVTYQTLFLIFTIVLLIFGIWIFFFFTKVKKAKDKILKETREAAESLKMTFDSLRRDLAKKIEYFDSKPGLNPREKNLRDEIMDVLQKSEETVSKEIKDIEKELKK